MLCKRTCGDWCSTSWRGSRVARCERDWAPVPQGAFDEEARAGVVGRLAGQLRSRVGLRVGRVRRDAHLRKIPDEEASRLARSTRVRSGALSRRLFLRRRFAEGYRKSGSAGRGHSRCDRHRHRGRRTVQCEHRPGGWLAHVRRWSLDRHDSRGSPRGGHGARNPSPHERGARRDRFRVSLEPRRPHVRRPRDARVLVRRRRAHRHGRGRARRRVSGRESVLVMDGLARRRHRRLDRFRQHRALHRLLRRRRGGAAAGARRGLGGRHVRAPDRVLLPAVRRRRRAHASRISM